MTIDNWIDHGFQALTLVLVVVGLVRGKALAISIDGRMEALLAAKDLHAKDQFIAGQATERDRLEAKEQQ